MSERIWEDAWVENGRLLVRFKDGNTIEIALIDDLVRKHQEYLRGQAGKRRWQRK